MDGVRTTWWRRGATALVMAVVLGAATSGCTTSHERADAPVLLFSGTGASTGDVAAVKAILERERITYATADSRQLDAMDERALRAHRLLIVPGGNFEVMGKGLAAATPGAIRAAVQGGLHYLGLCAGAFMAGDSPYNGINLTGVRFGFYALESQGVRKAPVQVRIAEGAPLEHYWEDGPQLTGWGEVVARYPDDTPAIVQGSVGKGWVVLTGVHPEAPETWRGGMRFGTPASVDNAHAARLFRAALDGTRLPHF